MRVSDGKLCFGGDNEGGSCRKNDADVSRLKIPQANHDGMFAAGESEFCI